MRTAFCCIFGKEKRSGEAKRVLASDDFDGLLMSEFAAGEANRRFYFRELPDNINESR